MKDSFKSFLNEEKEKIAKENCLQVDSNPQIPEQSEPRKIGEISVNLDHIENNQNKLNDVKSQRFNSRDDNYFSPCRNSGRNRQNNKTNEDVNNNSLKCEGMSIKVEHSASSNC